MLLNHRSLTQSFLRKTSNISARLSFYFYQMRKKNDILLKSAFEEAFAELLRFFFPEADSIFDFSREFEFLDKELNEMFPELQRNGGSRFVDMLVKVFSITGNEKYVLLHIEIQAQSDPYFGKRMFQYFYRIYDRYDIPVTALAIFTGGKPTNKCSVFDYHFLDTCLQYKYKAFHILDYSEQELLAMDNPFSLIVLAAQKVLAADKIPEVELAEQRLMLARIMINSKKYNRDRIRRFLYFLKTFIYIDNAELNSKFDQQIALLTNNVNTMGIIETIQMLTLEEGIEKGLEQGKTTFVKNLLLNTDFGIAKIAALADTDEAFVKAVQAEIKK
jgi:hypothetical protein